MSTDCDEAWRLTASEALDRIQSGQLSIEGYARSLLARIRERNNQVKAWVYLDEDLILANAKTLDQVPFAKRTAIHGLPIGVKDVVLTRDMPTQYNSRLYQSNEPIVTDAACVTTLRQSGALIFGKLTTTEFATSRQGDWLQNHTRNAHSEGRTPGGSSSGSGAAVADSQIPIAIGTQTGASIVRPASFNGCYGFKPTYNIISREGIAQWCISFDTCGFFARSVADLELMIRTFHCTYGELAGFDIRKAKVALCKTHNWHKAGAGVHKAMDIARSVLSSTGAAIHDLELPATFSHALDWHAIIFNAEGKSSFLGQYLTNPFLLHEDIKGYVEDIRPITKEEILAAYDGLAALRPVWDDIASQYDVILTPSVPDEAPFGLESTGDMSFGSMWTALHGPVLNIPCCVGQNNMPIGLSLVGARLTDQALLSKGKIIGKLFEEELRRQSTSI